MFKNEKTNRLLSKVVLTALIVNTLPVHMPLYGSALPKGQELITLKQRINRDINSIKKTTSRLKKLRIIIPGLIIAGGIVVAVVAAALLTILFVIFKKKYLNKWLNKLPTLKENIDIHSDNIRLYSEIPAILKTTKKQLKSKKLLDETNKTFNNLRNLMAKAMKQSKKIKKEGLVHITPEIKHLSDLSISNLLAPIESLNKHWWRSSTSVFTNLDLKLLKSKLIEDFNKLDIDTLIHRFKHKKKLLLTKITTSLETRIPKEIAYETTKLTDYKKELNKLSKLKNVAKKTILSTIIISTSGYLFTQALALAGITFVGFSIAIVAADKKATQLENLEKKYPNLLNAQQKQVLEKYKKLSGDPRMQGIIKNAQFQVALANIVGKTVKQYPASVKALGGPKKASKAFKKYAKRKWNETILQKALDVGVGKLKALKMKIQLSSLRSKLRKQGKKLAAKITKAKLNVAQFKKTLTSTAQAYIKKASDILENLQTRLAEAIEAEAGITKSKKATPVIKL